MKEKSYVLGFDPGGENAFGWSICEVFDDLLLPQRGGVASHAAEVMGKVVNALHQSANVLAIGIDAPLFWSPTGTRRVDNLVRRTLTESGHPTPSGTVQQLGSLQGACLVQGLLLASSLWEHFRAPITETHPKALLWLLDPELKRIHELTEHTQDAIVSAYAAWSMYNASPGWRDLYLEELTPLLPLGTPVSYWMPIP